LRLFINKYRAPKEISNARFYKTKEAIEDLVASNASCVDVGASKGDMLDFFIAHCKHGHHVAVEVIPVYSQFLESFYKHKNVSVYNLAVSNSKKQETLFFIANEPGTSGITQTNKVEGDYSKIAVESDSLDNMLTIHKKIDVLKISCIGNELKVLQGAKDIIKKHKPLIFLECTKIHNTPQAVSEIFEILDKNGYKISSLIDYPRIDILSEDGFHEAILKLKTYHFIATQATIL